VNISNIYERIIKIICCQKNADIYCLAIMNTHGHVYVRGLHADILQTGVIYNHICEVDFKVIERLLFL
jgi:hypothetical protein